MPKMYGYLDKETWKYYDDIGKELGVATTNVVRAALRLAIDRVSREDIKNEVLMRPTYGRRSRLYGGVEE